MQAVQFVGVNNMFLTYSDANPAFTILCSSEERPLRLELTLCDMGTFREQLFHRDFANGQIQSKDLRFKGPGHTQHLFFVATVTNAAGSVVATARTEKFVVVQTRGRVYTLEPETKLSTVPHMHESFARRLQLCGMVTVSDLATYEGKVSQLYLHVTADSEDHLLFVQQLLQEHAVVNKGKAIRDLLKVLQPVYSRAHTHARHHAFKTSLPCAYLAMLAAQCKSVIVDGAQVIHWDVCKRDHVLMPSPIRALPLHALHSNGVLGNGLHSTSVLGNELHSNGASRYVMHSNALPTECNIRPLDLHRKVFGS